MAWVVDTQAIKRSHAPPPPSQHAGTAVGVAVVVKPCCVCAVVRPAARGRRVRVVCYPPPASVDGGAVASARRRRIRWQLVVLVLMLVLMLLLLLLVVVMLVKCDTGSAVVLVHAVAGEAIALLVHRCRLVEGERLLDPVRRRRLDPLGVAGALRALRLQVGFVPSNLTVSTVKKGSQLVAG